MGKKKHFKIVIKDPKRFLIALGIFISIIVIICIIISSIINSDNCDMENIAQINAKKHSEEIVSKYETSEMRNLFVNDYSKIQNAVGMYIMNNSTLEDDSFSNIISKLKNVLKSNDWKEINISKPTTWNGEWKIDEDGNVKFKFSVKEIEPSWINDGDISPKIEFNK